MDTAEHALAQANECRDGIWRLWHYRAEIGEPRTNRRWLQSHRPPNNALILCGQKPATHRNILYDTITTGYLQFLSPSYVRMPQSLLHAHFELGKAGDEGLPEAHLLPPDSNAILIRTSEVTFCVVCKSIVFTRKHP